MGNIKMQVLQYIYSKTIVPGTKMKLTTLCLRDTRLTDSLLLHTILGIIGNAVFRRFGIKCGGMLFIPFTFPHRSLFPMHEQ